VSSRKVIGLSVGGKERKRKSAGGVGARRRDEGMVCLVCVSDRTKINGEVERWRNELHIDWALHWRRMHVILVKRRKTATWTCRWRARFFPVKAAALNASGVSAHKSVVDPGMKFCHIRTVHVIIQSHL
jgi:hypothetical protein